MNKLKTYKYLSLVMSITIALSLIAILNICNENKRMTKEIADNYVGSWVDLCNLSNQMYRNTSIEGLDTLSERHNAIIFIVADGLEPMFDSSETVLFYGNFLTDLLDPLVQELSWQKISLDKQKEGLELYIEINTHLNEICHSVLDSIEEENNHNGRYELIDMNSKLYKDTKKSIDDFCNLYTPKINAFFEDI